MKNNLPKSIKFAIAIVVQLAIVAGLVVFNAGILARGKEVVLPVEPVDPRDWIRGDYITVQYGISTIGRELVGNQRFGGKKIVYVSLAQKDGAWGAVSVSTKKPPAGLFIKGNVRYVSYNGSTSVVYGIENYFIPEGTGADLGQKLRDKDAFAKVLVDKNGNAVLKDIYFMDKPAVAAPEIKEYSPIVNWMESRAEEKSDDETRKKDIAMIAAALEKYYQANGKYPLSGGAGIPNSDWSMSNGPSWDKLQKEMVLYLEKLPKDPVNDQDGWPGEGDYAYGYFSKGYGCSQQWYVLVAKYDDADIASPGITACDGTNFDYPGTVTVGVCNGCKK